MRLRSAQRDNTAAGHWALGDGPAGIPTSYGYHAASCWELQPVQTRAYAKAYPPAAPVLDSLGVSVTCAAGDCIQTRQVELGVTAKRGGRGARR
jgi:hypothetical protein